jgi:hypothetical protein
MRNVVRLLLCLPVSYLAIAQAVTPAKSPSSTKSTSTRTSTEKKADAKTLVHDAKKALAEMIKEARADKALDSKIPKNKPFWKSTQSLAKSLKTAESGLAAKNNDFFKGVEDARQAEAQMKVDWQLTDSKNQKVISSGKTLGHALAALRTGFSKEAARKSKGGQLTAEEKAQFAKIKAQQNDLLAKIKTLQAKASKDNALEKGLNEIESQANKIKNSPDSLDAYLAALYLLDLQTGLIRGYQYYVDKDWRDDYQALTKYADWYDTWYVEWVTPAAYDWVTVDTPTDIYYDVDVQDAISDADIESQDNYAETESVDMTAAEEDAVAAEEDEDTEAADDEDTMEDASDDEGEDMGAEDSDEGGDMEDGGADDSGGDDSGGDDGGGEE